jgi:zinc/manganese transport system substrate-binding protein
VNNLTSKKRTLVAVATIVIVAVLVIAGGALVLSSSNTTDAPSGKLKVVAAENFWGSLVSQLGGSQVDVLSVVSDPNADPHEYESNVSTAKAIATADLIIINGAGYDTWAENIIALA